MTKCSLMSENYNQICSTHLAHYILTNYKFKMFISIQIRHFNTSSESLKCIIYILFKYILHLTQKGEHSKKAPLYNTQY